MSVETLIEAMRIQAEGCIGFGAPFTAALSAAIADDLAAGGPSLTLLAPWCDVDKTRTLFNDAVPLRPLAALHDLVLSDEAPTVAAHYPIDGDGGDAQAAWRAAVPLIAQFRDQLASFMTHEPQTNEVGRSMALLGGFLTLARDTGLPLRCTELGASAGLNQYWDGFHYLLGGGQWGDPASPIQLSNDWSGSLPPLDVTPNVIARSACDRRPVRLADPQQRRRLQAYVWPDMKGRLPRLQAAIDLALRSGVDVVQADAVDFARERAAPAPGAVSVLYHSVFWQYMPAESQAALTAVIAAHAAQATPDAPFAWLRMEPDPGNLRQMEVRLTLWPTGEDRLLGLSHPHAAWVDWRG